MVDFEIKENVSNWLVQNVLNTAKCFKSRETKSDCLEVDRVNK